jgi:hypothetical protein
MNKNKKLSLYDPQDTFIFHNCDGFLGRIAGGSGSGKGIEELGYAHTASHPPAILASTDKRLAKRLFNRSKYSHPGISNLRIS